MQRSPAGREQEPLLVSVPGVGPVLATTLLAAVPELGCLNRKETLRLEETLGTSAAMQPRRRRPSAWLMDIYAGSLPRGSSPVSLL